MGSRRTFQNHLFFEIACEITIYESADIYDSASGTIEIG